jgi:hypothetical protein
VKKSLKEISREIREFGFTLKKSGSGKFYRLSVGPGEFVLVSTPEAALKVADSIYKSRSHRFERKRGGRHSRRLPAERKILAKHDKWAKKHARPNPGWYIHVQKHGRGPVLLFNGQSFSNQRKPLPFTNANAAMYKARHLLGRYQLLSQYKIWVSDQFYGAPTVNTRVNPKRRNPEKLDEAARKLEDFTGREATHVERVPARSKQMTGLVIGEMDEISYDAAREGIDGGRTAHYVHKFSKNSRPLLAVSTDGKQLHVVGGQYEFTEAGIEDRG